MTQDTLLGFPAHTLPYRCGEFATLSTVSGGGYTAPCFSMCTGNRRISTTETAEFHEILDVLPKIKM